MAEKNTASGSWAKTNLILVIAAFVIFIVLGSQLLTFSKFISTFTPFAVFIALLLVVVKLRSANYHKLKDEGDLDEILVYLTGRDIRRDFYIDCLAGLAVIMVPVINRNLALEDVIQAVGVMVIFYLWHRWLFRKKPGPVNAVSLDQLDRIMDEVAVYTMPVILLIFAFAVSRVDLIDFIQAAAVLLVLFFWHKLLFKTR